jgi:hypothetical protein
MEVSGHLRAPISLPPRKEPLVRIWWGWVGPRAVLDAVVKRKIPSPRRESKPRTLIVQPVAQRYTDWAIMALLVSMTVGSFLNSWIFVEILRETHRVLQAYFSFSELCGIWLKIYCTEETFWESLIEVHVLCSLHQFDMVILHTVILWAMLQAEWWRCTEQGSLTRW